MKIDRCICTEQTFGALLVDAHVHGWSLPQLIDESRAGTCCTMCRPYVCRAYRTGQTQFVELLNHDDEPEPTDADAKVFRRLPHLDSDTNER
jgi:hypothetical protein